MPLLSKNKFKNHYNNYMKRTRFSIFLLHLTRSCRCVDSWLQDASTGGRHTSPRPFLSISLGRNLTPPLLLPPFHLVTLNSRITIHDASVQIQTPLPQQRPRRRQQRVLWTQLYQQSSNLRTHIFPAGIFTLSKCGVKVLPV